MAQPTGNAIIYTLKQQKAEIMLRLHAFNRRHRYREPTAEELATFELDKKAVLKINAAIERHEAPRTLTRADMQAQLAEILGQEHEAVLRTKLRRR